MAIENGPSGMGRGMQDMAVNVPKVPVPTAQHNYLGKHKQAFPTGFVSAPSQVKSKARAEQGNVGFDVAKGTKAGY